MSVAGIASSILAAVSGTQSMQTRSQQIQSEFQQLGQDLKSGNLSQAQTDFVTLSKNFPDANQTASTSTTPTTALQQAFSKLGTDLQAGNLQGAQQDFTAIQQAAQQNFGEVHGHRNGHHHHSERSENSSSAQPNSPIKQDFNQLAQSLQSGNLQDAQKAFAALTNDLQHIGGFTTPQSASTSSAPAAAGSLNVTA